MSMPLPEHAREIKVEELTDEMRILGAKVKGQVVRHWDDGFGTLWVYRESLGILGVVRAHTYEEAYSCVVDEIMDDATWEDVKAAQAGAADDAAFALPEGFEYRGSGTPSNPSLTSAIASYDLNGQSLSKLDAESAATDEITLVVID